MLAAAEIDSSAILLYIFYNSMSFFLLSLVTRVVASSIPPLLDRDKVYLFPLTKFASSSMRN